MTGGSYNDRAFTALMPFVTAQDSYAFPWRVRPAEEFANAMVVSDYGAIVSVRKDEAECRLFIELAASRSPTGVPDDFVRAALDCAFVGPRPQPGVATPDELPWTMVQEGNVCRITSTFPGDLRIASKLSMEDAGRLLEQAEALWCKRRPPRQ